MSFKYRSGYGERFDYGSSSDPYWDGAYVMNPHWVDYGDGVGEQLCGGSLYSKDGKYLGHIDPPGMKGHSGFSGYSGYINK